MNQTDIRGRVLEARKISEKCWEVDVELPPRASKGDRDQPPEFASVRLVGGAVPFGPMMRPDVEVVLVNVRVGGNRSKEGKIYNGLVTFEAVIWPYPGQA